MFSKSISHQYNPPDLDSLCHSLASGLQLTWLLAIQLLLLPLILSRWIFLGTFLSRSPQPNISILLPSPPFIRSRFHGIFFSLHCPPPPPPLRSLVMIMVAPQFPFLIRIGYDSALDRRPSLFSPCTLCVLIFHLVKPQPAHFLPPLPCDS